MVRLEGMKDLCRHIGIWNKNASRQLTIKPVFFLTMKPVLYDFFFLIA